jgi:hypothetical protein
MTTLKKIFNNKLVITALTILVLYTVIGFWLVPYLLVRIGPTQVAEKIQRELRLGKVKLNPFLFQFQADNVGLHELDGSLIAGFKKIYIDFELVSLFRWALVFKTFRLEQPQVYIVIDPDGSLNLAKLQPETAPGPRPDSSDTSVEKEAPPSESNAESSAEPAEKESAPLRMILQHIQIVEGQIDFIDQRQSIPATVAIRPLNIDLRDISTLPDREGPYNLVATTQDQESFHWTGEISLHPFKSNGRLGFSDIKMATLWQFLRDAVTLEEPNGRISIESDYEIDLGQSEPTILLSNLEFNLADLSLMLSENEVPLLELAEFRIKAPQLDISQQTIAVDTIQFAGALISVVVDEAGDLNWNRIPAQAEVSEAQTVGADTKPQAAAAESTSKLSSPEAEPSPPWQVQVAQVTLGDVNFQFKDTSRSPQLFAEIGDLSASFKVGLETGASGTELRVYNGSLGLKQVSLRNPDSLKPEIGINAIQVVEAEFDLAPQQLNIQNVIIQNGDIQLSRESDGNLNLISLFVPPDSQSQSQSENQSDSHSETQMEPQSTVESEKTDSNEKAAFNYAIQSTELSGFKITFSDKTVKENGHILQIDNLQIAAKNIDGKSPMPAELSFDIQEGGRVELTSKINPLKPSVQAHLDVQALSLVPFESYIQPLANMRLTSGTFSTQGDFGYQADSGSAQIFYLGGLDVSTLQILPPDSDETLLGWSQFGTQDLKFQLEPNLLEISDLKLSGLDGQFIIFEDGSINLTQMFSKDPESTAETEELAEKDQATTSKPSEASEKTEIDPNPPDDEGFPIYIHKLRFEDGGLFFADYSLIPQFATRIHQLEGSIIGMSSQPGARAQVQLDGRVDEYGLSKIDGEINFFDPSAYTDMAVLFRNLEMTRLTPYSGKFVGRRIDSGKLTLDLKYNIEDRKLKGDNQIIVEQIELGDKVESPDAVSLPLNLAIAILEDADGVIDLGLPVTGDLDDPKFNYGQLIWKAFVNLITKLATAPFRALGALLGGDDETLDAIIFEAGSVEILPPEAEKLAKLTGALQKRPNLKLIVQGRFSQETDGQALKDLQVRRQVVQKQGITLAPDEDPGLLDFGNPAIQAALEQVFSDHFGPETLAQHKQPTETEPNQVTDQPTDNAKEKKIQDPAALWKDLFQKLVAEAELSETALVQLAETRASAVLAELQGTDGLAQHRTMLKPAKILKPGKTPRVKMILEALKAKRVKKSGPDPE